MHDLPPFPGFRDEAFTFLKQLKQNNERDWFKPRKETFEDEVLWPLRCLVADASRQAAFEDLPLTGDPKKSLFRIYRDTRFSKNKLPYKTHASAVLSRSGSNKDNGVVYIHVEPGASFIGGGYWRPDNDLLRPWRNQMAQHPVGFLEVVRKLEAAGLELDNDRDKLKRMPRGFENQAESDMADYLRWKSFVVTRSVPDEALQSPAFTDQVIATAKDMLPLLAYGWDVLDEVPAKM
jgi:uncharacterized protein (TIGR02453 family)